MRTRNVLLGVGSGILLAAFIFHMKSDEADFDHPENDESYMYENYVQDSKISSPLESRKADKQEMRLLNATYDSSSSRWSVYQTNESLLVTSWHQDQRNSNLQTSIRILDSTTHFVQSLDEQLFQSSNSQPETVQSSNSGQSESAVRSPNSQLEFKNQLQSSSYSHESQTETSIVSSGDQTKTTSQLSNIQAASKFQLSNSQYESVNSISLPQTDFLSTMQISKSQSAPTVQSIYGSEISSNEIPSISKSWIETDYKSESNFLDAIFESTSRSTSNAYASSLSPTSSKSLGDTLENNEEELARLLNPDSYTPIESVWKATWNSPWNTVETPSWNTTWGPSWNSTLGPSLNITLEPSYWEQSWNTTAESPSNTTGKPLWNTTWAPSWRTSRLFA